MKENEMQELNEWIAINVMGWKLINYENGKLAESKSDFEDAARNDGWTWDGKEEAWKWRPTTDKAAAFEVLSKCAEKRPKIWISLWGDEWFAGDGDGVVFKAETFQIAIAKLARQLFAKEGV